MYYEINVSLNEKHFFSTSERSLIMLEDCKRCYLELKKRFSAEEGFEISVTRCVKNFYYVSVDELLN